MKNLRKYYLTTLSQLNANPNLITYILHRNCDIYKTYDLGKDQGTFYHGALEHAFKNYTEFDMRKEEYWPLNSLTLDDFILLWDLNKHAQLMALVQYSQKNLIIGKLPSEMLSRDILHVWLKWNENQNHNKTVPYHF